MLDALTLPMVIACGMAAAAGLAPIRSADGPHASAHTHTQRAPLPHLAMDVLITGALLALAYTAKLMFVDFDTNSTALEEPIAMLLLIVFTMLVLHITPLKAVYVAVWAQIIASISFECVDLLTANLPNPVRTICQALLVIGLCALLFVVCRRWLGPQLQVAGTYLMGRRKLVFAVAIAIMFLLLSNYQLIFLLLGSRDHSYMVPAFRIMASLLSLSVLYLQNDLEKRQQVQMELGMVQQLWQRQQSQYEFAKENIDIINHKCHDLKYQLAAFRLMHDDAEIDRQLGEVERSVMIYDSTFATGNPVLDVVLTEKSLYCEAHQITFTCMADGSKLDFIEQTDLYALFGNALDNAIESVMKQSDPQKRVIQIAVYPQNGFLMIQIRNYCDEPIALRDGLPVTSKTEDRGYHGYGLRGIRQTAEKYGGTMDIRIAPESFTLQVLVPLPVSSLAALG